MAAVATEVTLSVLATPLTEPVIAGAVQPKGLKLQAQAAENIDNLTRRMLHREFDVGEMSIATFVKARAEGLRLVGLPLFTSGRVFPHRGMLFSTRSGITTLAELRGRRVVVPQYWFTPTVWQRMIVQDEYGIRPEEMSWVCLQPERFDPPGVPGGVRVDYDSSGRSARDVLADGDADASLGSGPRGPDDAIRPAFPDPLQAQRDFYLRTGISSLQHVTVVKEELASGELVAALCDLYERAKEQANPEPPAGMGDLLGDDPWHFGIAANRTTLEALLRAAHTQGMIARSMQVEELFAPNLPLQYR